MALTDDQITHDMRQNDRLPAITAVAFEGDNRVDLTVFASITFKMVASDGTVKIAAGTATGDANGNLSYAWASGDTDTVGEYEAVFKATDGTGKVQTFPTKYNLKVSITAAL